MLFAVSLLRFRMRLECIKPDKLDASTTIKGLDYIDVPGMATRDYKLTFYSHKECQPLVKVSHVISYSEYLLLMSISCRTESFRVFVYLSLINHLLPCY
jgi:hypothetical protein